LEADVRLLANPLFVRMAGVLVSAVAAFVIGAFAMRFLRRRIVEDEVFADGLAEDTVYPYSAVIQELKQQKFALQHDQQEQQRRAKTSEHVTASVIANLPCGILFVAANGLVRQANAAARQVLGFASPVGMSIEEVFRDSNALSESGAWVRAADVLKDALHDKPASADLEFYYDTPAKDSKSLRLRSISLHAPSGDSVGAAIVIIDESAVSHQRRTELLRSETSAELALELHTSLATIREYASQMAGSTDREFARTLANDISLETERLSKVVGGFLVDRERKALAARA
jgi:signal transduction histidine kinase